MKLSIYMAIRNGTFLDYPYLEVLKHHLALADEIVINEGHSDDDTYERICGIDPKIRVERHQWDRSDPTAWHRRFKDAARQSCTGDWCILLDCDEFIPEWEFDRLRSMLKSTSREILPVKFLHFYANYRVVNSRPEKSRWPLFGFRIHKNRPDIETVGDGAQIKIRGGESPTIGDEWIECHHFGAVRRAARLRQKWRNDGLMKRARPRFDWVPTLVYDLLPHKWLDEDFIGDLEVYEGPLIAPVLKSPERFTRDSMQVYKWLQKHKN